MYDSSKLFHKPGYVSLKAYIKDIDAMRKNGSWKLPLGIGDRLQLFFLKMIARFSWFADTLYIVHPSEISPSYAILLSYIKKQHLIDEMKEKIIHCPGYFSYSLERKILVNGHMRSISGYGIAGDKATALSKAFGEILERVISGAYDMDKNIFIASADTLARKSQIFYPPKYHRFLDIQKEKFKELSCNSDDPIPWIKGRNLITKEEICIPRQITSWFIENNDAKKPLINTTTSGSAGYFTRTGAILRGLLETIQRDSFLVHWLTQIAPPVIRQDTLPEDIREELREFQSRGVSLHILDVTALSIPSVIIVAINTEAKVPQIILSGASATTFEQAIRDALREMAISAEMFYYTGNKKQLEEIVRFESFVSPLGQIGRQLYWRGTEKIKQFQWFLSGTPVSYDDLRRQDVVSEADDVSRLASCLRILKDRGSDYYPIAYFPKHPIQEELGFFIAQVYIPKAFPLYLLECQGTFDSDRLQEFALSKGISDWTLNPLPHMFP